MCWKGKPSKSKNLAKGQELGRGGANSWRPMANGRVCIMSTLSRRSFVTGGAALGAFAIAGMMGCAPSTPDTSGEGEKTAPVYDISETKECDIVVVGGGMSGLAAAVSASAEGNSVILLEANKTTGGNGHGTEGIFACGTEMQKQAGINFTFKDVISEEFEFFNYLIDARAWKDLVDASADNVEWLAGNGVKFDGVDDYRGQGKLPAFHWYAGGANEGYIIPMTAKAEEQGVEILYSTRGRQLLAENGVITGIIAEQGDAAIQINAKAVVLATGGYADNDDKVREMGVDPASVSRKGFPHHEGDGLDMAVAVGGVDERAKRCFMREPGTRGANFESALGALGIRNGGPVMFVNQNGERYTNENCIVKNQAYACNAILCQKKSFVIMNDAIMAQIDQTIPPIVDPMSVAAEAAIEEGAGVYKADTIEQLAEKIGVPVDTLVAELARYNEHCANGEDVDFGKEPEALVAMEAGPYWAFEHGLFYFSTIGGIRTNRMFEVVDVNEEAIPGLWAVGTDGCMLYGNTYTVMMPASCMANNINSGRKAGAYAIQYCKA